MSEHDELIAQLRRGGLMTMAAHERAADALAALVRERDEARACAAESAAILRRVQDSRDAARAQVATLRAAASAALHELITLFQAIAPAANVGETNRAGEGSPAVIALRAALRATAPAEQIEEPKP